MIAGILLGILTGLVANELCEFSPWCARKLVRWTAFRRYADPGRAEMLAEELTAVINDRPGNLFKLITAVGFAVDAIIISGRRAVARRRATRLRIPKNEYESAALGAELEHTARTGQWDRSRYPGRSEARIAVLADAGARGWQLADVQAAVGSGTWPGLAQLYERRSEPGRMDRLLPYEWRKAVDLAGGKNVRG